VGDAQRAGLHLVEAQGEVVSRETLMQRLGKDSEQGASGGLNAIVFRLRRRIERVCDSMECRVYPLPDREAAQDELFRRMESEYHALSSILDSTHQQRCTQLQYVARRLDVWALRLQRERCVLLAMNQVQWADGWSFVACGTCNSS
jgi:vacuolar-type H+-ATPase subunit I/STV1